MYYVFTVNLFTFFVFVLSLRQFSQSRYSMRRLILLLLPLLTQAFSTSKPTEKLQYGRLCAIQNSDAFGTYFPFAEYGAKSLETFNFKEDTSVRDKWENEAKTKGMNGDAKVKISCRAWRSDKAYARYALLETLPLNAEGLCSTGIQVFNFGIFPPSNSDIPVLGVDLVSLPGDKNLILLDAQPMSASERYRKYFRGWHEKHVTDQFPWGGDLPEQVKRYVSPQALWTRLTSENGQTEDPLEVIQGSLFEAYKEHLDIYLNLLETSAVGTTRDNWCDDYMEYRLQNDPAKPMLKSLFGAEWTSGVLESVLFPNITSSD